MKLDTKSKKKQKLKWTEDINKESANDATKLLCQQIMEIPFYYRMYICVCEYMCVCVWVLWILLLAFLRICNAEGLQTRKCHAN